ncbi:MAG TPA: MMPL family transporter [Gaiellaceae bacterium]|nr:MMPL family transporter [Gaiellaceae bacterium]
MSGRQVLTDCSEHRELGRTVGVAAQLPFERWTRFVLRHRLLVLSCWALVLAAGVLAARNLPPRLSTSFVVPQTDSARAQEILTRAYGLRPDGSFTVVFPVEHSRDRAQQAQLRRRVERASRVIPGSKAEQLQAGGGIVWIQLATTLRLADAKAYTPRLRQALASDRGPRALVSGQPAIQHDLDPILASDLRRGEWLALPLAVAGLLLLFGFSRALVVPFAFAACTIMGTLLLVLAATQRWELTPYTRNLVVLIGLGLALDYSLLVVSRYREELANGSREAAVVRTMATAGRAIVFSGLAVALGLALLLFVPVPVIRSMGFAGLLIPLVSIAATLTALPIMLTLAGGGSGRRAEPRQAAWAAFARAVIRRRYLVLLVTGSLLLVLALPARSLELTPGSLAGLPGGTEAARGLARLGDAFGPGALTPTEVVVDGGAAGAARNRPVSAAANRLADRLFHDPEVYVVASGPGKPYVDGSGRYRRVIVVGRHEYGAAASRRLVERIRDRLVPAARFPPGTRVYAGGAPPQGVDFLARSYASFPWLVLAAVVLTYLILVRAFRSLVLPLKAVVLNLLAVAASYGLLVLVFRYGVGADLIGVERSDQIEGWIPIFLLAVLFGLSMDYEVFLVSRMREAWDEGRSNDEAIVLGIARTGRLISVAALVMVAAFTGFVTGDIPGLQQFGLGLALAVLIDATLVRLLLVPSVMAVLGRWNWWLPRRLRWLATPGAQHRGGLLERVP